MPRIPAVDRRVLRYGVTVTSRGQEVEADQVLFCVLPLAVEPTASTAWTVTPVEPSADPDTLGEPEITVVVAGPEAGPGEGVVLPRGRYKLRVRAVDNPESITEVAEVITVD